MPYIAIAVTLLVLALAVAIYRFPRLEVTSDFRPSSLDYGDSLRRHSHLWLGVAAIFIYVGAEVSIGSFVAKYIADLPSAICRCSVPRNW